MTRVTIETKDTNNNTALTNNILWRNRMALYGPAIFNFLANTTRPDPSTSIFSTDTIQRGVFNPMPEETLVNEFGFGEGAEKTLENFKNNLFRLVMLRARNQLIQNKIDGKDPQGKIRVQVQLDLTDRFVHPANEKIVNTDAAEILNTFVPEDIDTIEGYRSAQVYPNEYFSTGICGSNNGQIEGSLNEELAEFRMPE